jgi:hypothetical protein
MATSGTYNFTVTRNDIIREAMLNTGKIGQTESPTAQETTDCARKLNLLVKQWMGKADFAPGLKMWTRYRGDLILSSSKGIYTLSPTGDNWAVGVTLSLTPNQPNLNETTSTAAAIVGATAIFVSTTAAAGFSVNDFVVFQNASGDISSTTCSAVNLGTGQITVPAITVAMNSGAQVWNYTTKGQSPLELQSVILRDNQENDTPIDYMSLQAYEALPTKVQPGYLSDPTSCYYEPTVISGTPRSGSLYLDVAGAQDVTKQLHIVCLSPIQDFDNPLDNPEYSQEWYRALCWGLTKEICPMFNAVWTKEMGELYNDAVLMAREVNPETTDVYFQPGEQFWA